MIAPALGWSVGLVVLACCLNRGRVDAEGGPQRTAYLALSAALALALLVVVALAEWMARTLEVTPPAVRLAAGAAVGVSAVAAVLARRGPDPAGAATAPRWPRLLLWSLSGLARVEVVVAVWSTTLDQGRVAGGGAALAGTAAAVIAALFGHGKGGAVARPLLGTAALCVAVVVGVNGVLGL